MDKNYILIIGWVAVMAILSVLTSVKQEETVCGKKEYRWRPVWAVVTVLPLVWMCSQRGGIMDTGAYLEGYKDMLITPLLSASSLPVCATCWAQAHCWLSPAV